MNLPAVFQQRIRSVFGAPGAAWLETLPALLQRYAERWNLTLGEPFDLSYNYVTAATRSGTAVVLKAGVPNPELLTEIAAMRLFDGKGAARVITAEPSDGIMLLERVQPGTVLAELFPARDDEATLVAAQVMRNLWRPLPVGHPFPTLAHWTRGIERMAQAPNRPPAFTPDLTARAIEWRRQLLDTTTEISLLHGDLHHYNILSSDNAGWLLIDPKGVAGDRAYECASFLLNPLEWMARVDNPARTLTRRIDLLGREIGIASERILRWAFVHALLSAWWSHEDGEDGSGALAAAKLVYSLF